MRLIKIKSDNRLWISNGEELIANRQNCSQTARKEARKGKTNETGIGLNLDLNRISTVTSSTLKEIESIFPEYTTRPLAKQFKYKESKVYNILIFDTETTTTGKSAELLSTLCYRSIWHASVHRAKSQTNKKHQNGSSRSQLVNL